MDRRLFLSLMTGFATAWPSMARAVARPPMALRRLRLVNCHTGETFDGAYRNDQGPIPRVIDELCIFLRDHHSGEKTEIDVGVIDFLADVLDSVGQTKATVLSAYRTAETNAMLARTMFGVAEHSQHILARAMERGGVGWYPHSGFIHIDTGPVRNWTLDDRGLDGLLVFDGQHLRMVGKAGEGNNRMLLGGGAWQPLTVTERLGLQRQLARAEFLARTRSLRFSP